MAVLVSVGLIVLVGYLVKRIYDKKELEMSLKNTTKKSVLILAIGASLQACGIEQIDEGYRGIETNWGKVIGEPLKPGLYFYNPISSDIFEMSVKEEILTQKTSVFTKDTQNVEIEFALTFYPQQDKIGDLYKQFGRHWEEKVIIPAALGSIKDAIGQWIADDLVSKREKAKNAAFLELKEAFEKRGVVLTRIDFTNLDFDDGYEKAVEQKVIAVQKSAEEKNKTQQVEEKSKQIKIAAQADAEAMRIKSAALAQNKGLVEYEAIQKWDGKLPEIMMGNSVPIINLDKLKK